MFRKPFVSKVEGATVQYEPTKIPNIMLLELEHIDDFLDAVYRDAVKWVHKYEKVHGTYVHRSTSLAQAKASVVPSRFVIRLPYTDLLKFFTETNETYRERRMGLAKKKSDEKTQEMLDKVSLEFSLKQSSPEF